MSQPLIHLLRCTVLVSLAAVLLPGALSAQQSGSAPPQPPSQEPPAQQQGARPPGPDPHLAEEKAAEAEALGFLAALDKGHYATAYAYTSALLRSKLDSAKFAAEVKKDREVAGARQSRRLIDASYTTTLPGAPKGEYVVLRFGTVFAQKPTGLETVTMSYERKYWRVAGWFLK